MRRLLFFISKNPILHLFVGLVVFVTASIEIGDTIYEDLMTASVGAHHVMWVIGVWHCIRALGEMVESANFLEEGLSTEPTSHPTDKAS